MFSAPLAYASNVPKINAEEAYFPVNFKIPQSLGNVSRLRSWSLPDNRTNGSTDSETSDYPSDGAQTGLAHIPRHHDVNAARESEYIANLLMTEPALVSTPTAPALSGDAKWSASNIFTPHDANWQHCGSLPDKELLGKTSTRVSPDAVAMTHNSPLGSIVTTNLSGTERFDTFNGGFGAGIAEFPRMRGGSLGSDALLYHAPHDERPQSDLPFNYACHRSSEVFHVH